MITTTTVSNEIKARVNDELNRCLAIARAKWPNLQFDFPNIEYRQIGRTAGKANYAKWRIIMNADFFHNGNLEDMIKDTGPHELAHLVAFKVYGNKTEVGYTMTGRFRRVQTLSPHGWEWKSIMRLFGLNPERCHDYNLDGVKIKGGKTFDYTCPCGKTFQVSRTIHNRVQMGQKRHCKRCKGLIFLKGTAGPVATPVVPVNRPVYDPVAALTQENFEQVLVSPPVKSGGLVDDILKKVPMPPKPLEEITVPRDWER